MLVVPELCLMVIASSHTSSNQTLRMVQGPWQWTPSFWSAPITTLLASVCVSIAYVRDDSALSDSREGSAGLEDEYGVLGAAFLLATALDAAAVADVFAYEPMRA
jgi:hypothetical protein